MSRFTYKPKLAEMQNIFRLRSLIKEKEPILYRELQDMLEDRQKSKDALDEFMIVSGAVYGLSRFKAMMYYYYIVTKVDISSRSDIIRMLSEYLISNVYLRDAKELRENLASNIKFDSIEDGIRWILAYRTSRALVEQRMYMNDEDTTRKDIPLLTA
jgi:hypothetical protein